jgi:hypothetical protein
MTLSTPVALIFFRRPASTVKVMERIRLARPQKLLLVCDGPRDDKPEEAELVARTRHDVEAMIDWDCDVLKNYSAVNEGLYKGLQIELDLRTGGRGDRAGGRLRAGRLLLPFLRRAAGALSGR